MTSRYRGCIEQHDAKGTWGKCVDTVNEPAPVTLGLYWNDRLLRHIDTRGGRFGFTFDEKFVSALPEGTLIDVRSPDGEPLVRYNPATHKPIGKAQDAGGLSAKFDSGYVLDKWGALKQPFSAKSGDDRRRYAGGMASLTEYFKERFDLALFPHYGTLLGYARSKAFLPHDDDTDMSYISKASSVGDAVDEFFHILNTAREDGHHLWTVCAGQTNITIKGSGDIGPDVFLTWHQADGSFFTYFGVVGNIPRQIDFFTDEIEGVPVNIPTNYEEILALTYGPNWMVPDTSFRWIDLPEEPAKSMRLAGSERLKPFL